MSKIKQLISDLKSGDKNVRRQAAEELGELSDTQVISPLVECLHDSEVGVREAAGDSLIKTGGAEVVKQVIPILKSESEPSRNLACEILEAIGSQFLDLVLGVLDDPDADVRKFIADVIGNINDKRAVQRLIRQLHDPVDNVVTSVIESLGKLGDPQAEAPLLDMLEGKLIFDVITTLGILKSKRAVKPLLDIAKNQTGFIRYAALEAIGKIGDKSILSQLTELLKEKDITLQRVLLQTLGNLDQYWVEEHIGEFPDLILPEAVLGALSDDNQEMRRIAVIILGQLDYKEAPTKLFVMLGTEGNEELNSFIVNSLVRIGKRNISRVLTLIDQDESLRQHIPVILGDIQNKEALPALFRLTRDGDPVVRCLAVRAVGKYSDPTVFDILIEAMNDEDEFVRQAAMDSLGWLGDERAVNVLFKGLSDPAKSVGESAVASLIMIGGENVKKLLLGALVDQNKQVRILINYGLANMNGPEVIAAFINALNDEDWEVRKSAVDGITKIGQGDDIFEHLKLCYGDEDPRVRAAVVSGLAKVAGEKAVQIFKLSLNDSDQWVRFKAEMGLRGINTPVARDVLTPYLERKDD